MLSTIAHYFTFSPSYSKIGKVQNDRTNLMTRMLLKLMLPISIVEKQAWREWLSVVDPSFSVPSVQTVKSRFDPMIAKDEKLIEKQLADIEYVNVRSAFKEVEEMEDHFTISKRLINYKQKVDRNEKKKECEYAI